MCAIFYQFWATESLCIETPQRQEKIHIYASKKDVGAICKLWWEINWKLISKISQNRSVLECFIWSRWKFSFIYRELVQHKCKYIQNISVLKGKSHWFTKMGLDGTLYSQRSRKMMVLIQFGLVTLDWCVQKIKKSTLYINIIAWACVRLTAPAPMSVVFLDNIAFSKASNAKTIFFLQLWLNLN